MRKYGIAPYLQAIQAGLGSIMVSDATWNGASLTSSKHMIVDLLKTEFAFKGFVATDWNAADTGGGVVNVVNAGVDMLMQPHDWKGTITLIQNGVADVRMNDAVTRILNVKCEAGLFGYKRDTSLASSVGSAEHRAIARKAVQESMVLLQNTNKVLPLAKTSKVFVTGSGADSLVNQCGGWTIAWQGGGENTGTTIKAAIAKVAAPVATQAEADVVVVVLSETPYAEFLGDVSTLNKFLGPNDLKAVDDAHAAGKKVVAIVLSGRPLVIADHLANADAWIAAWLPGTEGDGVADILYGTATPSGKLSHSWPKTDAQANVNIGDPGYDPLFKLGFGLTY
jgi:beta-glucosidase